MSRILIVEDEPAIAFTLENDLEAEGYEIAVVADGVEAVRRALSEPFDLILLDVMLPNKDGFEVCRELRRGGLSTRIIMLTAKTQEAEKILGLDMGADDYVTKPFSRVNCVRASGPCFAEPKPRRAVRCIASAASSWTWGVSSCAARASSWKPPTPS
jgi:DNA-binding response OmpR family regulator